jgi:hypothetical protein
VNKLGKRKKSVFYGMPVFQRRGNSRIFEYKTLHLDFLYLSVTFTEPWSTVGDYPCSLSEATSDAVLLELLSYRNSTFYKFVFRDSIPLNYGFENNN